MDFMLVTPPVQTSPMFDFDMLTSDWFSNAPTITYGSACDFNLDAGVFSDTQNNAAIYDGSYFDLNGFLDNAPMAAEIPTGFEDLFPPVGFAAGASSSVADHDYDWSALTPANELPTLPAPPASSPSPSVYHAPSPSEPPISAKAKGKRKEVDEENIVTTRRNRVRRTRSFDNQIGEVPPTKKTRSSRLAFGLDW
jgi:hypothetical protein